MTSPIDNELAPTESGARLPALGSPEQPQFMARVKEVLEVLLGRRGGSNWDRAVTFRDLYKLGITPGNELGFGGPLAIDSAGDAFIPGGTVAGSPILFDQLLRQSPGYKNLMTTIGSAEDLAMLPDEFRQLLQHALADVARERQADIQTMDRKLQNSTRSLASRLTEITAALEQTAAGVRQFDGAYADNMRAVATSIKQVTAALGNLGEVTVEEKFTAQADVNKGLLGQWSLKIQTNPTNGQPPVIAGIDLAVTSPVAGPGTSALIFMAEKFGFYTNNGTVLPFGIDNTGNVYVNGTLRVNDGGKSLTDLANGLRSLSVSATSQVFQIKKDGTNAPGSVTLKAMASNLNGSPSWTIPSGTATLSAGANAWEKVLTFANMGTDAVTVQVAQDGLSDAITIIKVREGADAINGLLTNEAVNVATDSAGNGASFTAAGGTFKVYDGPTEKTGAGVTYTVASSAGVTISINAAGVYSVTAMSADTGSAVLRAVYKGVTLDKVYTITKARAGAQGPQGPQGNQGVQGPQGPGGIQYYTWVKYADNATGAGMYDTPTSSTTHIGIAVNKTEIAEGADPAAYVWSKFRGDDGVQGPQGADGAPTYTWIKYGTSAAGANLSNDPSGRTYIGFAYNKSTAAESNDPADYVWSLMQGPQGPQGPQGQQGPQGPQGNTGSTGQRGNMDIAVSGYSGYSGLSTTDANNIFLNATGFWRQERDRMTLYNSTNAETRVFIGSTWQTVAAYINGNMVVNGTLSANVLSGGEIRGVTVYLGPAGEFQINSNGLLRAFNANLQNATAGNLSNPTAPSLSIGATAFGGSTVESLRVVAGAGSAATFNGMVTQTAYSESDGKGIRMNNCVPVLDNTYNCGTLALRWMGVTSATPMLVSSDQRGKMEIQDSDLGLTFIRSLRPVSYRMREASYAIEHVEIAGPMPDGLPHPPHVKATAKPGKRRHYGLLAQQVREQLVKFKADGAAFWAMDNPDDPESAQGLRYEGFIAPLIRSDQQLADEIDSLKATIAALQKEMQRLAALVGRQ